MKNRYVIAALLLCAITLTSACGDRQTEAAKRAIEATVRDPSSTQYRSLVEYSNGVVCGEFNTKNAFGGYDGFESFIYKDGRLKSTDPYHIYCTEESQAAIQMALSIATSDVAKAKSAMDIAEQNVLEARKSCSSMKQAIVDTFACQAKAEQSLADAITSFNQAGDRLKALQAEIGSR